jgi:lysophospholipase
MTFAISNPYQLTQEAQLSETFYSHIVPFWEQHTQKGQFEGVGGLKIHYALTHSELQTQELILISPGRTESYMKYRELAVDLSRQGYDIAIIDHRGQGYSDRTSSYHELGDVNDYDDYVADLHQLYALLSKDKQYKHHYLLAHSMGCAIGALYLQRYPNDFDAAVLSSPMFGINLGAIPAWVAHPLAKWLATWDKNWHKHPQYSLGQGPYKSKTFEENILTHSAIRYQIFLDTYNSEPTLQLGGPSNRWLTKSFKATQELLNNAATMVTPTLIIQSGGDSVVSNPHQVEFCQARNHSKYPCARGGVVTIDDARHELFIEEDNKRIPALTLALDFFAQYQ